MFFIVLRRIAMRAQARDADQAASPFLAPAFALAMWNPLLAGAATLNGEAHESYATLVGEWQSFVGRRLKEDMAFAQRLAGCTMPDQFWTAYVQFWQKAAEDYGCECTTMSKLVAGITNETWKAAQSATEEAAKSAFPSRKAA
jgi:Phasin protein